MNVYESNYYKTSSQKDKVASILYAEGGLDVESLTAHVYGEATKKNKNRLHQYITRLQEKGWLEKDKSDTPMLLRLTSKAEKCIKNILRSEKNEELGINEDVSVLDLDFQERLENYLHLQKTEESLLSDSYTYKCDCKELSMFDVDLAEKLLTEPERFLETLRICLEEYSAYKDHNIKLKNAESIVDKTQIGDLRVEDYESLVCFDGIIKTRTSVQGVVVRTVYECPKCKSKQELVQDDETCLKKAKKCYECGWKGKFRIVDTKYRNRIKIKVNEMFDRVDRHPEDILVEAWDDLADQEVLKKAGTRIQVTGIYDNRIDKKSRETKTYVRCLDVTRLDADYTNLNIVNEDIKQIHEISRDDPLQYFCEKVFPNIHGWHDVKQSLVLQAIGCPTYQNNVDRKRGDIHILMAGDPGVGKSSFMRNAMKLYGKSTKTGGKGSTGVGLIGSVSKDEDLGEWVLEGGALATNTDGLVCVDEFDKMGEESRSSMHEAMEDQVVPIHKANIHSYVKTKTSILAACNPKHSRFESDNKYDEINLKHSLMQRFDLVWAMEDNVNHDQDMRVAQTILSETKPATFETLRKYVVYARQNYEPVLTEDVKGSMKKVYSQIRKSHGRKSNIGPRFLQSIERLTKAHSRLCLRDEVQQEDFMKAFQLIQRSLDMLYGTRNSPLHEETVSVGYTQNKKGVRLFIEENEGRVSEQRFVEEFSEDLLQKYKDKSLLYNPINGYVEVLQK